MLDGKTVILGVTGSIAAYKIANLASMLVKLHADVRVIMTKNATNFINPITFETLTGRKCLTDTFDRNFEYEVEHISLAKKADVVLIAPASANVIGKIAGGIADDMLTTTIMACTCKKIIAPAMNTNMYNNPILKENLKKLNSYGYDIIRPAVGMLACKDEGEGKLPSEETLLGYILREIRFEKDLNDKKVLITAGPTIEPIDPVRYITNHSTGRMGYALANIAAQRGADVTLVSGPVDIESPMFVKLIKVKTAEEMFDTVTSLSDSQDIIIKSAAVADYTPEEVSKEKVKKKDEAIDIKLKRTKDILAYIGENKKPHQFLCGFSMETENLLNNSIKKLKEKKADMIVANNLREEGAGFGTETNVVTLITKDEIKEFPLMTKEDVAIRIIDMITHKLFTD